LSRKIDARELVAALGGLMVLVSLFLDWFERDARSGSVIVARDNAVTGWQVFESLDLVLAALAILAIATGAAALGTIATLRATSLLPLGLVLALIVVVQLVSQPPAAWGADPAAGAWLALAGALLVLIGGVLTAASIDVTVNVGARDTRRRVPAVDRRPSAASSGSGSATSSGPGSAPAATPDPAPHRSLLDDDPGHGDPEATQPFRPVDEKT
jgi:hypothetical protein